ncbi:MAG: hypothetical protein A3D94_11495 [Alphaproteobacteria bacterium RIFCSPHIGHO2_12_FULL_66_14]|nr:MAG: hypothetical protein A3D94_11495 [Alphaproteobacteria bacterium RIFCSPHIGHO2_12_FULL_66_14]
MVRTSIISLMVFATLGGPAKADEACVAELNKLVHDWRSIAVPGVPAVGPNPSSKPAHYHDAGEVWYMRSQIRLALRLCNENKSHEAMLRMDVVRAWLKLPEVQHPTDHRRTFDEKDR